MKEKVIAWQYWLLAACLILPPALSLRGAYYGLLLYVAFFLPSDRQWLSGFRSERNMLVALAISISLSATALLLRSLGIMNLDWLMYLVLLYLFVVVVLLTHRVLSATGHGAIDNGQQD